MSTTVAMLLPSASQAQEEKERKEGALARDNDIVVLGKHAKDFVPEDGQVGAFRNQTLLDTPLTVTVVNRQLLDAENAQGLDDALRNVAGVTQQGTSPLTSNSYAARGVVANARTNFRLNGTLPIINYLPMPIEDKERVEALKGVSALYYGFTSPSVIVNMVTKRAGKDPVTAFKADADVEGTYGVGADIGRLYDNGRYGMRLNGYAAHLETPIDGVHGNRWLASGAFDIRPTDHLSFQLDAEHYERRMGEPGSVLLPNPVGALGGIGGTITLPPLPDPHTRYAPVDADYRGRATNILARMNYRFTDAWSLHVDAGMAGVHRERWVVDVSPTNLFTGAATLSGNRSPGEDYGNNSARIELNGVVSIGPVRNEVLAGYSLNRLSEVQQVAGTFTTATNYFQPFAIRSTDLVFKPKGTPSYQYTHDRGFYALDTAHLGEAVTLIGGARQSHFSLEKIGGSSFRVNSLSPMGAIILHPVRDASLYSSYVEGLESGGTAPLNATNAGETLPPQVSRQGEIGVKAELRKALLGVALFRIDRALPYLNTANLYVSDGRARFQGVEASFQGALLPHLNASLTGQYLDAVQRRTAVAAQNGQRVTNAPRYAASAFAEYRPAGFEALGVNAGVYYTGRRSADLQGRVYLPAYALLSLGANYRFSLEGGHALILRVSADNVLDHAYWATGGDQHLYVGTPRTIRLALGAAF